MMTTDPNVVAAAVEPETEIVAKSKEVQVAPFEDLQAELEGSNNMVSEGSPNC